MSTTTTPAEAEAPRITFELVTLFPEMFDGLLATTVIGKAITAGTVAVHRTNPRDFGLGNYRQVDDTPYGGGPGMIMRVEPIAAALDAIAAARGPSHRILLTPRGRRFDQAAAQALAARPRITLVCGRYEGIDERVGVAGRRPALPRRLRAGGRRAGGGGRAGGRPRGWFRACSAAACPRATNRSRPGASSTRSGRAPPNGRARRRRPCCCRATTRRSRAGVGGASARLTRALRPDLLAAHPLTDEERKLLASQDESKDQPEDELDRPDAAKTPLPT